MRISFNKYTAFCLIYKVEGKLVKEFLWSREETEERAIELRKRLSCADGPGFLLLNKYIHSKDMDSIFKD